MSRFRSFLVVMLRVSGAAWMLVGIAKAFMGDGDAITKAAVMMTMCAVLVMDLERGEAR